MGSHVMGERETNALRDEKRVEAAISAQNLMLLEFKVTNGHASMDFI